MTVDAKTDMKYVTHQLCWQRLCILKDAGDGFGGVDYWLKHVLVFDVLEENWGGEATFGFKGFGQKMFDLMSVRLDADPNSQEYRNTYRLTWRLLTESTMQNISRGKGLTKGLMPGS